jgi:transposase
MCGHAEIDTVMMRIDAIWMSVQAFDMRAGVQTALAKVIEQFGAVRPHHAYVFSNKRANRIKLLVHDGIGVWWATRQLHQGGFQWPQGATDRVELSRAQWHALILGLPWQSLHDSGSIAYY